MAGTYQSWGLCRECGSEVIIHRKCGGRDGRGRGYNCGRCWFRTVARPMLDYARRKITRILHLPLFPRRRRA